MPHQVGQYTFLDGHPVLHEEGAPPGWHETTSAAKPWRTEKQATGGEQSGFSQTAAIPNPVYIIDINQLRYGLSGFAGSIFQASRKNEPNTGLGTCRA